MSSEYDQKKDKKKLLYPEIWDSALAAWMSRPARPMTNPNSTAFGSVQEQSRK